MSGHQLPARSSNSFWFSEILSAAVCLRIRKHEVLEIDTNSALEFKALVLTLMNCRAIAIGRPSKAVTCTGCACSMIESRYIVMESGANYRDIYANIEKMYPCPQK
jgi:hypothetical protein